MKSNKEFNPEAQFSLKRPCKNCPFLKPELGKPYNQLQEGRMIGIIEDVREGTFHCHKTTDKHRNERKHCAGAMAVGIKKHGSLLITSLAQAYGFIGEDYYDEAMNDTIEPEDLK